MGLGGRIHHQEITVIKADRKGRLASSTGPKAQVSGDTDAQGDDGSLVVEFWFVIGMPTHAIGSGAVAIEQEAVEADPELLFQERPQDLNRGTPGGDRLHLAAVAVTAAGVGHPAGQTRRGVLLAVDPHQGLLPRHLLQQALTQGCGADPMGLEPCRAVAEPEARAFNRDQGWRRASAKRGGTKGRKLGA